MTNIELILLKWQQFQNLVHRLFKRTLNRVGQPISVEYKTVHGLNQAVFVITLYFEMLSILDLSSYQVCYIQRCR